MTRTADVTQRSVRLIDGATVTVRQLRADDYDAVVLLSLSLTERERYLRFFTTHPGYLDDWARSVTNSDDPRQCAIGAFEDDALLGVGGYVSTGEPGRAEISVVVAHDQHDRGVGTVLLTMVGMIARDNAIQHLTADVLAENRSMMQVIADTGLPYACHRDGVVASYDLDLVDADALRSSNQQDGQLHVAHHGRTRGAQ
ncbi:GNAT family N-acetyltransferase [Mycolicibacterium sp. 050158]|jgi:Acetyltransferase (GNAT) domain|uniref:GNAT family N-acetyltransferase n=1 Tax=Mycolicibacterium sp. 050158 TaxID=3090602 RepID=UPI00299F0810|nr:GNAT family N-acetyltransferase [Mycolicibacterium sp. 050158]MDX1890807.1 GNAT family N-acetyltransferase [Mycolicibacterium sp. 050158]